MKLDVKTVLIILNCTLHVKSGYAFSQNDYLRKGNNEAEILFQQPATDGASASFLLKKMLSSYPAIKAAEIGKDSSDDMIVAARLRYLPELSTDMQHHWSKKEKGEPQRVVRLESTLWDNGLTSRQVDEANIEKKIADQKISLVIIQLSQQFIKSWYQLRTGIQIMNVYNKKLDNLEMYNGMMQRRSVGGLSSYSDLRQIESRIQQVKVELTQLRKDVNNAARRLNQLASQEIDIENISFAGGYKHIELSDYNYFFHEKFTSEILNSEPEIKLAELQLESDMNRVEKESAATKPQVYARLDQNVNNSNDSTVYVGVRFNSSPGFSNQFEIAAKQKKIYEQKEYVLETRLKENEVIMVDVDTVRNQYEHILSLKKAVILSQEVLSSYERQFTAGRKSWLDLLNAVNEHTQSQVALVRAEGECLEAISRLMLRHSFTNFIKTFDNLS